MDTYNSYCHHHLYRHCFNDAGTLNSSSSLKSILQLRFDCDTTTTRLRREIDMLIFRRSLVVVVSQSNRNLDHFRRSGMRRGIVVS